MRLCCRLCEMSSAANFCSLHTIQTEAEKMKSIKMVAASCTAVVLVNYIHFIH